MTTFRSLDLTDAITTGWRSDLNAKEIRVLNWIATRGSGKRSQRPGYPFVWKAMYGMDDWAEFMAMPRRTLFQALKDLQRKGLVTKIPGAKPTYGIPTPVMLEAVTWNVERKDMGAFLRAARVQDPALSAPKSVQDPALSSAGSCTPDLDQKPGLTSEYAPDFRKQENREGSTKDEERSSEEERCSAPRPCEGPQTQETKVSDGWDVPSDGRDDFEVPREVRERKKPDPKPSTLLTDSFRRRWISARTHHPMLPVDFTSVQAFRKELNKLMAEGMHTPAEIELMFDVFFSQLKTNNVQLRGGELWRDFLSNRARVWDIASKAGGRDQSATWAEIEALANRNKETGT